MIYQHKISKRSVTHYAESTCNRNGGLLSPRTCVLSFLCWPSPAQLIYRGTHLSVEETGAQKEAEPADRTFTLHGWEDTLSDHQLLTTIPKQASGSPGNTLLPNTGAPRPPWRKGISMATKARGSTTGLQGDLEPCKNVEGLHGGVSYTLSHTGFTHVGTQMPSILTGGAEGLAVHGKRLLRPPAPGSLSGAQGFCD